MEKNHIDVKMTDGVCDAYTVTPQADETLPAVILYMDAFGLRPQIFEMADKIASEGYFVLVPNLFYRMKKAPVVDLEKMGSKSDHIAELLPQIMPLIEGLTPDLQKKDTKDYIAFLQKKSPRKIACVGYCMGGAAALRAAANAPEDVIAVASYHASRLGAETPSSVLYELPKIRSEIYIAHADKDNAMPPDAIERVRQTLDKNHAKYKAEVYRDAMHGFTMSDHPAYNAAADKKHWETLFELLDRTLHA